MLSVGSAFLDVSMFVQLTPARLVGEMQEVHFHGRRSEGHRTLRGHARSTVLDTQTVVNSLPLNASDVPFRVVLTGSYNHTEQALVQRLHIANPVHI